MLRLSRVFRAMVPAGVPGLIFSEIVLICGCFYAAASLLIEIDPRVYFLYEGGFIPLIFALASILLALYFSNLYSRIQVKSRIYLFQQICQVIGITLVAQSLISYLHESWVMPRWLMIYGCAFVLIVLFCWRLFYSASVLGAMGGQRLLFAGTDPIFGEIANEIASAPERGFSVCGHVEGADLESLGGIARLRKPDRIVVGIPERRGRMPVGELLELRYSGLLVEEASAAYENICRRISFRSLQPGRLIFRCDLTPSANALRVQRVHSGLMASVLIVLLWPAILLIAVSMKLFRGGAVLDRQVRVGVDGRRFTMARFHMKPGGIGRRFHLDALPELFSVLRGEMSMVGPKAERPEFARVFSEKMPFYDYRHGIAPGMTGWAQINVSEDGAPLNSLRSLEYDLYYIKHMSLSLNAYILLHSLKNKLISW